jgi:16S rRNA A1518/A1519 N6-dimethyltransferase RsmA/KsgA/DIM1 with predicted DNA glycosylase/AP lyase activity
MGVETQFGLEREAYATYRPHYPASLFQILKESLYPPFERALDLGAGTGLSTTPLCAWFEHVIAVEPDPGMAQELKRAPSRITVIKLAAEKFNERVSSLDLITAANSFYWMDGPRVTESLSKMGILILVVGGS